MNRYVFTKGTNNLEFIPESKRVKSFLVVLSGVMLGITYSYFIYWLAWFALVPLLLAMDTSNPKQSLLMGLGAGLIQGSILFNWIVDIAERFTGGSSILGIVIMLVVMLYFAFWLALWCYGYSKLLYLKKSITPLKQIIVGASLWVLLEWLRTLMFPGIPWVKYLLAHTQTTNVYLIQSVSAFGPLSVSLVVIVCSFLLFSFLKRRRLGFLLMAILFFAAQLLTGFLVVKSNQPDESSEIRFSLIQENIPPELKWNEHTGDSLVNVLFDLNRKTISQNPDIILWTETSVPWVFKEWDDFLLEALRITAPTQATHLIGYLSDAPGENGEVYNSALLVQPDGAVTSVDHKVQLLAAIERPLLKPSGSGSLRIPAITTSFQDNLLAGKPGGILRSKYGSIGNLICNESLLSQQSREKVKNGASLLTIVSNDAWFSDTRLVFHHFFASRLRAVENRRDVVFNSNMGYAGVIRASGETEVFEPSDSAKAIPVLAATSSGKTWYTKFGDIPIITGLFVSLLLTLMIKTKKNEM